MSGAWLSIENAFLLAVEIAGVPEIAFQSFCTLITNNAVPTQAARKYGGWDPSRISLFHFVSWDVLEFGFYDEKLLIGDHDVNQLWIGKEGFAISQWTLSFVREQFARTFQEHNNNAPLAAKIEDLAAQKGRGGRPLKYDWAGLGGFIAAYIHENGYPAETQMRLIAQSFFEEQGLSSPDTRDLERFMTKLYARRPRET